MAATSSSALPASMREAFDPATAGLSLEEAEGLADYLSDTEFGEEHDEEGPSMDTSNVVVVDGLPRVPQDKLPKLVAFMTKVVTQLGPLAKDGLYMPVNKEEGKTEGFAFVEFKSVASAENAVKSLSGFKLDARHTLAANRYEDLDKHCKVPDEFVPPELPEYTHVEDRWSWLGDGLLRDQYAVRYDDETEICWAETNAEPVVVYAGDREREKGRNWTERQVQWSPQGTYFVTFHPPGIVLWGGSDFREVLRLKQNEISQVLFSPCERYIGTWNGFENNPEPEDAFIVWDLRSGAQLRSFKQVGNSNEADFVWSADGNYIGRTNEDRATGKGLVQIYETPHMTLLGKRSIIAPGVREIKFCPNKNEGLLSTFVPEGQNQPASVTLTRIPSREVVRSKQLFNVANVSTHWHPQGSYLAVQATLLSKQQTKKKNRMLEAGYDEASVLAELKGAMSTTFELFRIKDKGIPVETLKVDDLVHHVAWEPNGKRLAIVHGPGPLRFNISIYNMEPKGKSDKPALASAALTRGGTALNVELVRTLEEKSVNHLSWSPRGGLLVMAGLENLGGGLEFYDVDTDTVLGNGDHMQCSGIEWDPSGRLVASFKAQPMFEEPTTRQTVENSYNIWHFTGKRVYDQSVQAMFQFNWRPRPALLEPSEAKKVQRNLKKFVQKYEDEDRAREARRDLLRRVRLRRKRDNFRRLVQERRREYDSHRPERVARGIEPADPDAGYEIHREIQDVVVRQDVEPVE